MKNQGLFKDSQGKRYLPREIPADTDPSLATQKSAGLSSLPLFQVGDYLPENSLGFVGRTEETRRILTGLNTNTSFLILGGPQIGKTSLMRHIYGKLKASNEFHAIWLDCAGYRTTEHFLKRLRTASKSEGFMLHNDADPILAIEKTLRAIKRPVLLINEVDGLSLGGVDLLQQLCSLSEENACQLVMVGNNVAYVGMQDPAHPFYHWFHGEVGNKAFMLGALNDTDSRELVDLLQHSELELSWESDTTRTAGYRGLIENSYGIPLLLQKACQGLVERLHQERRTIIRLSDIESEEGSGFHPVWDYMQNIKVPLSPPGLGLSRRETSAKEQSWTDLVFGVLVHELYFQGDPATVSGKMLRNKPSADLCFETSAALIAVRGWLANTLDGDEPQTVNRHFPTDMYYRLFDYYTLTVILEPVRGGDHTYHFKDHIYPTELKHYLQGSKSTIEDYILRKIGDLYECLRNKEAI